MNLSRIFSSAFFHGMSSLSLWPSHRSLPDQVNARLRAAGLPEIQPVNHPSSTGDPLIDAQATVAKAWQEVGRHLYGAMDQVAARMTPEQRAQVRRHDRRR